MDLRGQNILPGTKDELSPCESSIRSVFRLSDRLRFYFWKQLKLPFTFRGKTRDGLALILRQRPEHDLHIAKEIFAQRIYALPKEAATPAADLQTIVDVGANVGYSILYFLHHYPAATIIAFEPHPRHVACIQEHLAANAIDLMRVQLHPVAVSNAPGEFLLTDAGAGSMLLPVATRKAGGAKTIPVRVVDLFPLVENLRIDLFKMDIEGGEYPILDDPRFARLDIGLLVLEYHHSPALVDARLHCQQRLEALGYRILSHWPSGIGGVLWAQKSTCGGASDGGPEARVTRGA